MFLEFVNQTNQTATSPLDDIELFGHSITEEIIFGISIVDFIFFLLVLFIGLAVAKIVANSVKKRLNKMNAGE